jgi:prepilin-type N-terminal cleavage/methylation domain-containing protein
MKGYRYKVGVTLVEMLIVLAIITVLASMVIGMAAHIDNRSRGRSLENTFALLESALQKHHEYWRGFPDPNDPQYPTYSSSAVLYYRLDRTPGSRQILDKVSDSLIQNNPEEIYDPWGTVLRYVYFMGDNFPRLISAGPDRIFGTPDDIRSR